MTKTCKLLFSAVNNIIKYRAADMSEATLSLKIFENPEHGLHHVILSLPAGMDIAPDCWRFQKAGDATNKFRKVSEQMLNRGFTPVQTQSL